MYKTKTISYDARTRILWALMAISVLALALYIFAINDTIRNTVARQVLETELSELAAENSALEFAYIELKNSVSMELALSHGFIDVPAPLYVSRIRASSLTYNR